MDCDEILFMRDGQITERGTFEEPETPAVREVIYAQAKDVLEKLIAAGALFYEPGNLHVLVKPDGGIELKLIDFEPESKTAIPLEMYFTWFRRRKLARKARRFLAHLREKYAIRDVTLRQLDEERKNENAAV